MYSLDTGLIFEREGRVFFGEPSVQTLEPRLFYAYVPFRDQSALPNFDSALADFNFAQLFTENIYSGNDRIGEANQLTAALVGRVFDPVNGGERLRVALGQRYYFSSQRVTLLPTDAPRTDTKSDILFVRRRRERVIRAVLQADRPGPRKLGGVKSAYLPQIETRRRPAMLLQLE